MIHDAEFSKAVAHRLIKNQSNKRVSKDGGRELVEELTDVGQEIAQNTKHYAEHSGRKTIQEEDVRQAIRDYREWSKYIILSCYPIFITEEAASRCRGTPKHTL